MFLTTAENRRWRRWAWWLLLVLIVSYWWYASREDPHGGTSMGIFYGILGAVLLVILMLYGLRKRAYKWWRLWALGMLLVPLVSYGWYTSPYGGSLMGILYETLGVLLLVILMLYGLRERIDKLLYRLRERVDKLVSGQERTDKSTPRTLQTWVHSHIYLGLLVLVIILFHSGFRFHDTVAVTALILLTVVVVSGVVGVVLYTLVPPLLIGVDSNLTVGEMSDQLNQFTQSMARLASGKSAAFQAVYTHLLQAQRPHPLAGWRLLFSRPGLREADEATDKVLQANLEKVEPQEQTDLAQLYVLAGEMRQMHLRLMQKQRYRNILDVWLYLHVPLSFALFLVVAVHVIAALYYSRWGVVLWRTF